MGLTAFNTQTLIRWRENVAAWLRQPVAGKLTAGWVAALYIIGAILSVAPFAISQSYELDQDLSDFFVPLYSLLATIIVLFAGWMSLKSSRKAGIGWLVIGMGLFLNTLGEITWAILSWLGQDPFPSLADVFYLSAYPTLLAGILLLPFERLSGMERLTKFMEITIISLSASLILWNYLLGPIIQQTEEISTLGLVFTLAYPLVDMLLLLALLALVFRTSEKMRVRPLAFLGMGISVWIFADVVFSWQELHAGYQAGGIADTGYMFSSIFWGLAGVCQYHSLSELKPGQSSLKAQRLATLTRLSLFIRAYLPPTMLLIIYHMLWKSMAGEIAMSMGSMLFWMGVLLLLVSSIQILYTHQNLRLAQGLQKSNADLEKRVAERTLTLVGMTEALRSSEERYRAVVEDTPALVCTYSKGGILTFVNRAYAKYFNRTPEELVGTSLYDLILPQDRQAIEEKIDLLTIEHPMVMTEHRVVSSNGEVRWQRWVDRVVNEGDAVRYQAIGEDITEQRLATERLRESEERYRTLFKTMAQGVVYQDDEGRIVSANPAAERILGMTLDQMQGRQSIDPRWRSVHEDGSDFPGETHPAMTALRTGEVVKNVVMGVYNPDDDTTHWININAVPEFIPGETRPVRVYTTFEDITERKRNEYALQAANQQLQHGINELSLLARMDELLQLCQTDDEAYQAIDSMVEKIFPFERGGVTIAQPDGTYQMLVQWGDIKHDLVVQPNQCLALRRGRPFFVEDSRRGLVCEHIHNISRVSYICVPMIAQNEIYGSLFIENDLVEGYQNRLDESRQQLAGMVGKSIALALSNIRLRSKLREQAIRDTLTGLFNRRFMEEWLKSELLRLDRNGGPLSVLMLDIDHFKNYNDSYGHEAGDLLLSEAAKIMRSRIRVSDISCRYGGEEFILVLPGSTQEAALECAERIRMEISELRLLYRDQQLEPVTVSMGVAIYPQHGSKADELLRQADAALYVAKQAGRNRVALAGGS